MGISGGTNVIVQHASYLHRMGHDVTLAVQERFTDDTLRWHDRAGELRCLPIEEAQKETFDLVIATWWKTALVLATFDAPRYAYFVQSIESRFYPQYEQPLRNLVDATYRLPVSFITEATWIKQYLESQFDHQVGLARNGVRKDIYHHTGPAVAPRPAHGRLRVLVEGHFGVPFKNTALAAKLARKAGVDDIWVLTGSQIKWMPGTSRVFSRVPMIETAAIYRSCDLIVKLSTVEGMFGPPLEMFHCGGTAIVFNVSGHDEYIEHEKNGIVIPTGDVDAVIQTLRQLQSDSDHLTYLKAGAIRTAERWPDWEQSSAAFAHWIERTGQAPASDRQVIAGMMEEATNRYQRDETQRLNRNLGAIFRRKARGLVWRLSKPVQAQIRACQAVSEMVLPGCRVQ